MFRFTIRDVLWLMVVVGMGCAWFVYWRHGEARYQKLQTQMLDTRQKWGMASFERDQAKQLAEQSFADAEAFKKFAHDLQRQNQQDGP